MIERYLVLAIMLALPMWAMLYSNMDRFKGADHRAEKVIGFWFAAAAVYFVAFIGELHDDLLNLAFYAFIGFAAGAFIACMSIVLHERYERERRE